MLWHFSDKKRRGGARAALLVTLSMALGMMLLPFSLVAKEVQPRSFATPDAAVQAFVDALRKGDFAEVQKILGPAGEDIIASGDEVADRLAREHFLKIYDQKHAVVSKGETEAELVTGTDDWPFPIPLVKVGKTWILDAEAGAEEILDRRIGRNELNTLKVLEAYVQAQREYYQMDFDEDGVLEYAQKVMSSDGQRDGLFWPVGEDEDPSPLGPVVAEATAEGYGAQGGKREPYHGYFFKILTAQGPNAPGGAFSYVINGNMVAGYAMVAWPAEWDNSGLMTFVVNGNGVIYEKDLGEKTAELAAAMNAYNPDDTWKRAK